MYPGYTFEYRGIQTVMRGDAVYIRLHSGREMTYHRPRLSPSDRGGYEISYERWNTNPTNGPVHQWIRVKTWGGRLVENWNQATAREIFWAGVRRCELAGYRTVLHNYDENVAEVPEGFGSVSEMERIMVEPLFWTQGWPVRAEGGWRGKRYRK
jgi:DNA polymerase